MKKKPVKPLTEEDVDREFCRVANSSPQYRAMKRLFMTLEAFKKKYIESIKL